MKPNLYPKYLNQCTFLPKMDENPCCFTSSLYFIWSHLKKFCQFVNICIIVSNCHCPWYLIGWIFFFLKYLFIFLPIHVVLYVSLIYVLSLSFSLSLSLSPDLTSFLNYISYAWCFFCLKQLLPVFK